MQLVMQLACLSQNSADQEFCHSLLWLAWSRTRASLNVAHRTQKFPRCRNSSCAFASTLLHAAKMVTDVAVLGSQRPAPLRVEASFRRLQPIAMTSLTSLTSEETFWGLFPSHGLQRALCARGLGPRSGLRCLPQVDLGLPIPGDAREPGPIPQA